MSLQVGFVRTSNDTRNDVLHTAQRVCFRVLTHTLCIHLSWTFTSSQSSLRYQGVAVSWTTSGPLFSFSTHRRTALTRTTCPISFTTRCSSLSSARPTHVDLNVRGCSFRNHENSSRFSVRWHQTFDHFKQLKNRRSERTSSEKFQRCRSSFVSLVPIGEAKQNVSVSKLMPQKSDRPQPLFLSCTSKSTSLY